MRRSIVLLALGLSFVLLSSEPALAAPPPYYPPVTWMPASRANYDVGRKSPVVAIVIHETDGPWSSAVNWFQNSRSRVSAHYIVRAWGGGIVQMVAESDTAYHARNANPWSVGIETEYDPRRAIWHTDAQYRSAAALTCAIARRYGIPTDRGHIVGHRELADANHADPGPTWNWGYFMQLVDGCSWQRPQPAARAMVRTFADQKYVPAAGLDAGAESNEVALLQWDLAYLGFMNPVDLAAGAGRFGPLTQEGLVSFQEANGIPATGSYNDLVAKTLALALASAAPDLPAVELESGEESYEVERLQTALQQLGYMDLVTGYFGNVTSEAVGKFQEHNGLEPSGMFTSITRMALASRLRIAAEEAAAARALAEAAAAEERRVLEAFIAATLDLGDAPVFVP